VISVAFQHDMLLTDNVIGNTGVSESISGSKIDAKEQTETEVSKKQTSDALQLAETVKKEEGEIVNLNVTAMSEIYCCCMCCCWCCYCLTLLSAATRRFLAFGGLHICLYSFGDLVLAVFTIYKH